jgi:hypothetical protein
MRLDGPVPISVAAEFRWYARRCQLICIIVLCLKKHMVLMIEWTNGNQVLRQYAAKEPRFEQEKSHA